MNDSQAQDTEHHNFVTEPSLWQEYVPSEYLSAGGWIAFAIFVVFIVVGTIPQMLYGWVTRPNELGDSFGLVNALFSGFAVTGLIVTILIQIREFRLAQQERMDALETQKEISKQHAIDVQIQKKISDQQELTSLLSSVATWSDLNPERRLFPVGLSQDEVRYLYYRYVNTVVLNTTQTKLLQNICKRSLPGAREVLPYEDSLELADVYLRVSMRFWLFIKQVESFKRDWNDSNKAWEGAQRFLNVLQSGLDREVGKTKIEGSLESKTQAFFSDVSYEVLKLRASFKERKPGPYEVGENVKAPFVACIREFEKSFFKLIGRYFLFHNWAD